jgi:hypothetical protein
VRGLELGTLSTGDLEDDEDDEAHDDDDDDDVKEINDDDDDDDDDVKEVDDDDEADDVGLNAKIDTALFPTSCCAFNLSDVWNGCREEKFCFESSEADGISYSNEKNPSNLRSFLLALLFTRSFLSFCSLDLAPWDGPQQGPQQGPQYGPQQGLQQRPQYGPQQRH